MTDQDEAARQAESLLPCLWPTASEACHVSLLCINCMQRPAVAAALRERDEKIAEQGLVIPILQVEVQRSRERIAALEAEVIKAGARVASAASNRFEELEAENERLRAVLNEYIRRDHEERCGGALDECEDHSAALAGRK